MGKESFEDKIRQQLEGYEAPYDKSYWKKYAHTYPAPRLAWWKLWWMPYLFSSLLFGGAWFWFQRDAQRLPDSTALRDTVVVKELVVTRDTLVVRDTVVLVWGPENRPRQHAGSGMRTADRVSAEEGLQQKIDNSAQRSAGNGLRAVEMGRFVDGRQQKTDDGLQTTVGGRQANDRLLRGIDDGNENEQAKDTARISAAASDSLKEQAKVDPEVVAAQMDSIELAAIAEIPTEPESKMQHAGIFLSVGPRVTSLSPFNYGNFDTRFGTFVGGAVQIDWQKWQLEMGIQYGFQLNELDELGLVPLDRRQAFPGYSSLTSEPDEVGVISEHLLIPLQARFTVYDYRAWRLHVAGGALGNAVLGETFVYDKENVDRDRWERTVAGRGGLSLSHLNAGIGTSYQWRQNLELQAILNYYHPLRPLGLNRLEAGALSLQLGLNWLLLPR